MKKIAVLSGKGGVGKSTITINIALQLQKKGFKVGIMDADIDCPNIPQVANLPMNIVIKVKDDMLIPIDWSGIDVISLAWTMPETTPILFDDTQKQETVEQIIRLTKWKEDLDYLIVDCPAGTGGVLYSVFQQDIIGGIIVTTPHAAAVADAKRARDMLMEYKTPLIGIINNMAYIEVACEKCFHSTRFDLGKREDWNLSEIIGNIPFTREITELNIIANFEPLVDEILKRLPHLKAVKFYDSKSQKIKRAAAKFAVKTTSKV